MMQCTISQEKVFKILEWIFFIGLFIASGWSSSGVLQQFFSRKTSFSQHKEKVTDYPVVIIVIHCHASEFNFSDVKIKYYADGMASPQYLKIGENHLHNHDEYNKTENVILESLEDSNTKWRIFRIIHTTPILKMNLATIYQSIAELIWPDQFSDLDH